MNQTVWILTIVNLVCYIDRYIIASVAPKIQSEFVLTHAQTGFFMSAFMVGYMMTSPIFGYYGDRKSRPLLMAIGVLIWSFATVGSGLSRYFWELLFARALVGVGEASFVSLAPPFIRDGLKDEKIINKVLGVFYTAIPVGAAIGYIWGGWIADHFNWRYAFYIGSIPGFIAAYYVWKMPEPKLGARELSNEPIMKTLKDLAKNRDYCLSVAGYVAQTFAIGGFSAWGPHFGVDVLGRTLTESSLMVGASTLLSGIIGTLLGAKWGDMFLPPNAEKTGHEAVRAFCKFCGWTSVIGTPIAVVAFTSNSFPIFIGGIFLMQTIVFAALAPANTAVLAAVPNHVAATSFAVSIFVLHALGDVISPPLAGVVADHSNLVAGMLTLTVALGVSAVIWLWAARPQAKVQH